MKSQSERTIGLYTKVSTEEKKVIEKKMAQLGIKNLRAYLRKMAINGYIVHLDMKELQELIRLLRLISNNVNQIAKRANETHNLYAEDVEDIRQGYLAIWQTLKNLIEKLEEL